MASYNRSTIVGNATRDAECKYTANGTAICNLDVAVNRTWFDKQTNQKREECDFIPVTLWGRSAEIAAEYVRKGRPVLVEGRLKIDSWDDKETGKKRSKMVLIGEVLQLLGGGARTGGENQVPETPNYGEESQDSEVPF